MKKIFLILFLYFVFVSKLVSQSIYNSVESSVYGVCAASFSEGINSLGGNPANLNFNTSEAGVQYNSWVGDIFLITAQYSRPTFKNNKLSIANSINIGYLSSGEIEERDESANLLSANRYSRFVMSLLSSIDIKSLVFGAGINYLSKDNNSVYNNDWTLDAGVKYLFEYSDVIDIVLGISINNIMSDENDYILPQNIDNSIGLVYTDDDLKYGVGFGYLSVLEVSRVGASLFYENLVSVASRAKFIIRVFCSYSDYTTDGNINTTLLQKIKFGVKMDFGLFKIIYGYKNFGEAGNISSVGLNFNI